MTQCVIKAGLTRSLSSFSLFLSAYGVWGKGRGGSSPKRCLVPGLVNIFLAASFFQSCAVV